MPHCLDHGDFALGAPCPGCAMLYNLNPSVDPLAGATFPVVFGPGETVPDFKFCLDCGKSYGWFGKVGGRCTECLNKVMAKRCQEIIAQPAPVTFVDPTGVLPPVTLDPKGAAGALKAPLWLIPPAGNEEQAKAFQDGINSGYGAWNWRKCKVKRSVYLSAMKRHIDRILDGEDVDPKSGAHHLGHVMANCAIILDAARHGTLVIDGEEAE